MFNRRLLSQTAGALLAILLAIPALAQTPPAPSTPPTATAPVPETPYAVSYIEVAPTKASDARKALKMYRDASAKAAGSLQFDAFERIGYKHHFAIVEHWASTKARTDNVASPAGKAFRDAVAPMLITAYDERPHYALSTGPTVKAARSAVFTVTHVDIIPPKKDEGVGSVKKLADVSRGTAGNLRFDALTQANRPNHMTLVEGWKDRGAQEANTMVPATRTFRTNLLPMTGSLFDERIYTVMP
jgi:quinol monooxygenase YgiN